MRSNEQLLSSNELRLCDLIKLNLPKRMKAQSISAGSYHSAILTTTGEVLTFGSFKKGQLGREQPSAQQQQQNAKTGQHPPSYYELWFARPDFIPGLGKGKDA